MVLSSGLSSLPPALGPSGALRGPTARLWSWELGTNPEGFQQL